MLDTLHAAIALGHLFAVAVEAGLGEGTGHSAAMAADAVGVVVDGEARLGVFA